MESPQLDTPAPDHSRLTSRRKAAYLHKQSLATLEQGLLIVLTGPGKGKTTAAWGMALRAIGHGLHVGIIQFIKSQQDSAEQRALSSFPQVDFRVMGDGFTWQTADREQDVATAVKAWAVAETMIADPRFSLVILDELHLILKYGYVEAARVLETFSARRPALHIVSTGRYAPIALVEQADLVSEIHAIRHPYRKGIRAQKGIEF